MLGVVVLVDEEDVAIILGGVVRRDVAELGFEAGVFDKASIESS